MGCLHTCNTENFVVLMPEMMSQSLMGARRRFYYSTQGVWDVCLH